MPPVIDTEQGLKDADALQELFEKQQSLTTWHEQGVQSEIELYRALRETDLNVLKARAEWNADRAYVPDPLAEKISESFADMLFGEDPIIKSAETIALEEKRAQDMKKQLAAADAAKTAGTPAATPVDTSADDADPPDDTPDRTLEQGTGPNEEVQVDTLPETIPGDQELLNNLIEANDLPSELRAAEVVCSSEGEVWWREYVDPGQSEYPIIEWHSRSRVRPLFRGRKLIAAAFVSEIHREEVNSQWTVYRYVEIQAIGVVRNLLYKGTNSNLGTNVSLDTRPETSTLNPEWLHDFGILCGRIPNKLGRDRRVGISDYRSVVPLLFGLNEETTIGHENVRLTAKKRIAVPREALSDDGTFDASEDVLIVDEPLDDQLGKITSTGKFAVLEYSFDSQALIEHKLDTVATILSRCGIVAEFANSGSSRSSGGGGAAALSGIALRMRLIPTTLAANGKARFWDDALPKILMLAARIDAAPEEQGGFARDWKQPEELPSVERSAPLPTDENEETTRHVAAVGGEVESRRTAISDLHPNWDDRQVQEELDQIQRELKEFGPAAPPPGASPFGGSGGGAGGSPGGGDNTNAG